MVDSHHRHLGCGNRRAILRNKVKKKLQEVELRQNYQTRIASRTSASTSEE